MMTGNTAVNTRVFADSKIKVAREELIEQVYDAIMKLSEEERNALLKKYAAKNGWNADKL